MNTSPQGMTEDFFNEVYMAYHDNLFFYCVRLLKRTQDARDALAETFEKFWSKSVCNELFHAKFLLYVIARNTCINEFRRKKRLPMYGNGDMEWMEQIPEEGAAACDIIYAEYLAALFRELPTMPKEMGKVVELRLIGKSWYEIARMLHIGQKTVRSQVHCAKIRMADIKATGSPHPIMRAEKIRALFMRGMSLKEVTALLNEDGQYCSNVRRVFRIALEKQGTTLEAVIAQNQAHKL